MAKLQARREEGGSDPATAAIGLALARPGVSSVVVGTINPEHLAANVQAAEQIAVKRPLLERWRCKRLWSGARGRTGRAGPSAARRLPTYPHRRHPPKVAGEPIAFGGIDIQQARDCGQHQAHFGDGRSGVPGIAHLRAAGGRGAMSSCLDNLFTSQKSNIEHLLGKTNFEFIHATSRTRSCWRSTRSTARLGLPGGSGTLPVQPDQDDEDQRAGRDQHARAGQAMPGQDPPGLDQRGVQRPHRAPAAEAIAATSTRSGPGRATTRKTGAERFSLITTRMNR